MAHREKITEKILLLDEMLRKLNPHTPFREYRRRVITELENFIQNELDPSPEIRILESNQPDDESSIGIDLHPETHLPEGDALFLKVAVPFINHHLWLVKNEVIPGLLDYSSMKKDFHEFTHYVSHYLKSPLTAILGFATLLDEDLTMAYGQDVRHYSKRIAENSRLLEKMVNELLYISRLKKENEENCQIKEIVSEAVVPLQTIQNKKSIKLEIHDGSPPVFINREHLKTIFHHLIGNALKFSRSNSSITVGFNGTEFYVRDCGKGIKRENLEKVFQIFFTTCGKETYSTGAGLYIAKKIIELYGGSIRIETRPGEGTTVFFRTQNEA